MPSSPKINASYQVRPVTPDLWDDLAEFFGPRGATSYCWCTWWRSTAAEFKTGCESGGAGNREILHRLTAEGQVPGLLAYAPDEPNTPLGWASVAPRTQLRRVGRSRNYKPGDGDDIDDETVWSLVCFWIPRVNRGRGVAKALLDGAVAYAFEHGASAVDAYPVDTGAKRAPVADIFTGTVAMFREAGFKQVLRRSERRPVMRRARPH